MKGYYILRKHILDILHTKLPKDLYYHGVHHTMDALKTCDLYLKHIKISKHESQLLRLGILLHDIGFTESTEDHELKGIEIANNLLSEFHFSKKDIDIIKQLILSTKVPQQPRNLLERIICDIDLDYLGRDDYYKISDQLFRELKVYSGLKDRNEWNKLQVKFLEAHRYHTDFAIKNRKPKKELRIKELKGLIKT